jgi:sugar lactone lactonase YvrE
MLYAGSPTTHIVYKITLTDTPTVANLYVNAGSPNGLTMGPDGALYYTDIDGGSVYRVTPAGMRTKVNMTNIASPNGLAFGSDGSLYVESYSAGSILKLAMSNGAEQSRTPFVPNGLPNDDGIAFDAMGRLYIGFNGGLSRVSADGMMIMHLAGNGGTANVEFGAGALNCKDVYFVNGGNLVRFENDTAGAVVPWHLP